MRVDAFNPFSSGNAGIKIDYSTLKISLEELDAGTLGGKPISISSLASGDVLQYNGSEWVNAAITSGGVTSLNSLTGAVDITSSNGTINVGTSGQDVTIDINLGKANTWTAEQTFGNGSIGLPANFNLPSNGYIQLYAPDHQSIYWSNGTYSSRIGVNYSSQNLYLDTNVDITAAPDGTTQTDTSLPSWHVAFGSQQDNFIIGREPAGGSSFTNLFTVSNSGDITVSGGGTFGGEINASGHTVRSKWIELDKVSASNAGQLVFLDSAGTGRYVLEYDTTDVLYIRNPGTKSNKIFISTPLYTNTSNNVPGTIGNTLDDGTRKSDWIGLATYHAGIEIAAGKFDISNSSIPAYLGGNGYISSLSGTSNVTHDQTLGMDVVFAGHTITFPYNVIGIVLNQNGLKPSLSFGTRYINSEVSSGNVLLVFFSGSNVKITANGNTGGAITVFWIQSRN